MKAAITYTILIFIFFFQSDFLRASEITDMDSYVTVTAARVSKRIQENDRLIEIGTGVTGTYFVDQRLALDGITTVDTARASLYNRSMYQKYNGDVIVLLHIIYPEGEGGKKDVIDSTLLFSQRISELSDPQHNKIIIHVWSVINRIADKFYTFTHVIAGKNNNGNNKDLVSASVEKATPCGTLVCSLDTYFGIDETGASTVRNFTKYLTPEFELVYLNEEVYIPIEFSEKGPLFAFTSMRSAKDVDKGDFFKYDFTQKVYINTYNGQHEVIDPVEVTGYSGDPKLISSEDLKQGRVEKMQTFYSGHLVNGEYFLAQRNLFYFTSAEVKNEFLNCVTNSIATNFCDLSHLYNGSGKDCRYLLDWNSHSSMQVNLKNANVNQYSLSTNCCTPSSTSVIKSKFEGRESFKISIQIDLNGLTLEDQKLLKDMTEINKNKAQAVLFVKNGKVFKVNADGTIIEDKSKTYAQLKAEINAGSWSDKTIDQMTLLKTESINGKNIVQVDALGFRSDIKTVIASSNTQNSNLNTLIQSKTKSGQSVNKTQVANVTKTTINNYLKKNNVENKSSSPSAIQGGDFPDGKSVAIDPRAACLAIAWEGLSMTTEFLKTASFDPKIYDDNTPSMIKLPPILTGGIEGGARAVTDITSLVTMGIELTLDDTKRADVVNGFSTLKDQFNNNPAIVMPLVRDAILEELVGLNADAISNISLTTGEGMHNLSKGVAVITLNAASLVATLPKAAGKISFKLAAQNVINTIKKNINLKNKLDEIRNSSITQYNQLMDLLKTFDSKLVEYLDPAKFNLNYLDELKAMFVKNKTKMVTDGCDELCAYSKYGGCFIEGTEIATLEGFKPIEKIQKGDTVWSYNTVYRKIEKKAVTSIKKLLVHTLCILVLSDGYAINTTPDHPFYVNGTYIEAKSLTAGMQLYTKDGRSLYLQKVNLKDTLVEVYNFSVPDNNNYFVGNEQILVHNNNKCLLERFTGGEFPNLTKKFDGLTEADKTKFLDNFAGADDAALAKLEADKIFLDRAIGNPDYLRAFKEYDPNKVYQIKNQNPINSTPPLPKIIKTVDGIDIKFDGNGFPDFTDHVHTLDGKKQFYEIDMKGTYEGGDFSVADSKAGISKQYREQNNLTWHHHQDGKTMMLVPQNINSGVRHTGGKAIVEHNSLNPNNILYFPSPLIP